MNVSATLDEEAMAQLVLAGPIRTAAEIAHGTPSVERVVNTISVTK